MTRQWKSANGWQSFCLTGAVTDLELVRGSLLDRPVFAGEVVCAGRLKADRDQLTVPEGMCALSVPGKDVQTVGGRLAAGMEADAT